MTIISPTVGVSGAVGVHYPPLPARPRGGKRRRISPTRPALSRPRPTAHVASVWGDQRAESTGARGHVSPAFASFFLLRVFSGECLLPAGTGLPGAQPRGPGNRAGHAVAPVPGATSPRRRAWSCGQLGGQGALRRSVPTPDADIPPKGSVRCVSVVVACPSAPSAGRGPARHSRAGRKVGLLSDRHSPLLLQLADAPQRAFSNHQFSAKPCPPTHPKNGPNLVPNAHPPKSDPPERPGQLAGGELWLSWGLQGVAVAPQPCGVPLASRPPREVPASPCGAATSASAAVTTRPLVRPSLLCHRSLGLPELPRPRAGRLDTAEVHRLPVWRPEVQSEASAGPGSPLPVSWSWRRPAALGMPGPVAESLAIFSPSPCVLARPFTDHPGWPRGHTQVLL